MACPTGIIINEDVAGDNEAVTTAQHEFFHGALFKTLQNNPGAIDNMAQGLRDQIDEMEDFLDKVHPRREIERNNYARNEDIINHGRASNEINIVSWETLDDNMIGAIDPELWIQQFDEDEE